MSGSPGLPGGSDISTATKFGYRFFSTLTLKPWKYQRRRDSDQTVLLQLISVIVVAGIRDVADIVAWPISLIRSARRNQSRE